MLRSGGGFIEMSVDTYEPAQAAATIFCLHDYWGNSRDFRQLAGFLVAHQYRVVCPDLPGRGDSAYLADAAQYRPHTFLIALMALIQRFKRGPTIIIGKGWGALVALLLNVRMTLDLDRLIATDVPLNWTVDEDRLPSADALEFATLEQARQSVLGSPELANLPEPAASALVDGRVRQTTGGRYALRFDPVLVGQLRRVQQRSLDTTRLFARIRSPLLYLSANPLPQGERNRLQAALANPQSAIAESLSPGGQIHFNSAHQQLLVLGFLQNRPNIGQ
ncbi:alpha/beta hydrolase [Devosia sp.]|uniref:alpha/beta hydrolase n=1 Tax=Devosia sp. TaxID=1871048 RepID=UPI00263A0653|nr:alpha/beta hydrolase [Devosia sp.]